MDNPQEFLPPEPLNHETTPSGTEWGAMAPGFVVGLVWFIGQQVSTHFLFNYLNTDSAGISVFGAAMFVWGWMAFGLVLSFVYGLVIGFTVSYRARHHHHRFTIIVIMALFVVTLLYSVIVNSRILGFSSVLKFMNIGMIIVSLLLNLAGGLNGVSLAQSVKRNRGVRIN